MTLNQIYSPIREELDSVEETLREVLLSLEQDFFSSVTGYLLDRKGKRLRPALVLLSAKLSQKALVNRSQLVNIATAIELIHMASLVHDDVIDNSNLRYNKPTINSKWGKEVSITFGDYLFSVAFELVASSGNPDIVQCISSATKAMCEGEFLQVSERDNLDLLKERYLIIIKKKTASLFMASCHSGTLVSAQERIFQEALKEYGLNLGIAFQIADDYLDLVSNEEKLGKLPGQDITVGEITLPLLNLLETLPLEKRELVKSLLQSKLTSDSLLEIRTYLISSRAIDKTEKIARGYINTAKKTIEHLPNSEYKESLLELADFIIERSFNSYESKNVSRRLCL